MNRSTYFWPLSVCAPFTRNSFKLRPTKPNHTTRSERIIKYTKNKFMYLAIGRHCRRTKCEMKQLPLNWNVQLWTQQFNIHLAYFALINWMHTAYTYRIMRTALTVWLSTVFSIQFIKMFVSHLWNEAKQCNKYTKYKYMYK